MNNVNQYVSTSFIQDLKNIIGTAQTQLSRSVEFHLVEMYWRLGEPPMFSYS